MLKRPKPGEDEDELLAFQEKFLAESKSNPSATLVKMDRPTSKGKSRPGKELNSVEAKRPIIVSNFTIGEVIERQSEISAAVDIQDTQCEMGFPVVEKLTNYGKSCDNEVPQNVKKKKKGTSIFAQKMAAGRNKTDTSANSVPTQQQVRTNLTGFEGHSTQTGAVMIERHFQSNVEENVVDFKTIHEENMTKLKSMSDEEILAEQRQLISRLDPSTIGFLKNRSKVKQPVITNENSHKVSSSANLAETSGPFRSPNDRSFSNEGQHIWDSDLPEPDPSKTYSIRFDFQGLIVTNNNLPVHLGLHHHGEEQEVPGYTVDELFMLSKSSNSQQKLMAVKTLALICKNAKLGCFVGLEINVFQHLIEKGLPILFRLVLDEQNIASICVAVQAFSLLLHSSHTENVLDVSTLCSTTRLRFVPMKPFSVKKTDSKKPEDVIKIDLLKGLNQTNILIRLRYIIEVIKPPPEVCSDILKILQSFSRHSMSLAYDVFKCPRLLDLIVKNYLDLQNPFSELTINCMKLLLVIISNGVNMAKTIVLFPNFEKFVLFCLTEDLAVSESNETSKYKLSVISLVYYLVEELLQYQLFTDQLSSVLHSVMMRTVKLQTVEIEKCSSNEVKFLVAHFSFCATIYEKLSSIADNTVLHVFLHDCREMTLVLSLKWLNTIVVSEPHLINGVYSSVFAVMLKIVNAGPSHQISKDLNENFDQLFQRVVRYLKSGEISKLFSRLIVEFPHKFVISNCLLECYYDLDITTTSFYTFEFISSVFQLASKFQDPNQNHKEELVRIADNFLKYFTKFEPPLVIEKDLSDSFGYSNFIVVVKSVFDVLIYLKNLINQGLLSSKTSQSLTPVCLKLISECPSGYPDLLRRMFRELIFDQSFHNYVTLTEKLSELNIDSSVPESENREADVINEVFVCFESSFPAILKKQKTVNFAEIESLLVEPSSNGPELPKDWLFYPILSLIDQTKHKNGDVDIEYANVKTVRVCLKFLCTLSFEHLSTFLTPNLIFDRLMCVFMLTSAIFMDNDIKTSIRKLLLSLIECTKLTLKHDSTIDGAFYEHYVSLLEHFEAESFGDQLFANLVLLPMCTRFDPKLRRAVWTEFSNVFKVHMIRILE